MKAIAAVFLLLSTAEAMAACGPPRLLSGIETALSAALDAKAGPTRRAALEEAARLIAEGGEGSPELAAYLQNRAAARNLVAAGSVSAARERLAAFDFRALATKVATEAEQADCPEGEGETVTPGVGTGSDPAAAMDRFDATISGAGRGAPKPISAAGAVVNRSRSVLSEPDPMDRALLALLVVIPALAFAVHRIRLRLRRREGRFLCYLPAALGGRYRDESVSLVDFSRNGLRLTLEAHMLEVGERVDIEFVGLRRAAHIRWTRRRSVGVRLNEPMSDAEFDEVTKTARRGAGMARA